MTERDRNLDELFAVAADSTATPEDIEALDEILRADADTRREYLRYQRLNALLERYERIDDPPARPTAAVLREICETVEVEGADSPEAEVAPPARRFRASRHKMSISIAVAVAVMVSTLLTMHLLEVSPFVATKGGKTSEANTKDAADHDFIASLSDWHSDRWLEDTRPPRRDPRLKAGTRLVLASGLIEIEYETGAVVVLEGPAEYEVIGKKSGFLRAGKLTAHVHDEKAKGFTVETPSANLVDLGTEFGVEVTDSGASHLHVFEGRVRMDFEQDDGSLTTRIISAGHAGHVAVGATQISVTAARKSHFVSPGQLAGITLLHDDFSSASTPNVDGSLADGSTVVNRVTTWIVGESSADSGSVYWQPSQSRFVLLTGADEAAIPTVKFNLEVIAGSNYAVTWETSANGGTVAEGFTIDLTVTGAATNSTPGVPLSIGTTNVATFTASETGTATFAFTGKTNGGSSNSADIGLNSVALDMFEVDAVFDEIRRKSLHASEPKKPFEGGPAVTE